MPTPPKPTSRDESVRPLPRPGPNASGRPDALGKIPTDASQERPDVKTGLAQYAQKIAILLKAIPSPPFPDQLAAPHSGRRARRRGRRSRPGSRTGSPEDAALISRRQSEETEIGPENPIRLRYASMSGTNLATATASILRPEVRQEAPDWLLAHTSAGPAAKSYRNRLKHPSPWRCADKCH